MGSEGDTSVGMHMDSSNLYQAVQHDATILSHDVQADTVFVVGPQTTGEYSSGLTRLKGSATGLA